VGGAARPSVAAAPVAATRPFGGQSYTPQAAQPYQAPYSAPVQAPAQAPQNGQPHPAPQVEQPAQAPAGRSDGQREPVVVPDSLEPVRAGRPPRSVTFDEVEDDLDVPDFLK
jgi:hypothetical protein